ncbi:MAG: translocation/assembly module TamB domain-containing protein [Rhodobacteraceae bacterium]|nr:translocation/assembly module TamB domain-containing protein [Paracoccaceae bacterium]
MTELWTYSKRLVSLLALMSVGIWAVPAPAQDADTTAAEEDDSGGMLVSMLENLLSNENQSIRVIGLQGALSARAQLQELQILDRDGPWLILRGAVLDWNRLALVRGRFSVNELTAQELIVTRAPLPVESDAPPPAPEASADPFALPDLPVAIQIEQLGIGRIELGEALAGQAAELSLDGSITFADGTLAAQISSDRLDRPGDAIRVDVSAVNETREIAIDLGVDEAPGGLLGDLMNLPGSPELKLSVEGSGLYDDLVTDILLATDGEPRLAGQVELTTGTPERPGTGFTADVGGDLRALLAPAFHPFFGADTRLTLSGRTAPEGVVVVDTLALDAEALALQGSAQLTGPVIDSVQLDALVSPADGGAIVLPVAGGKTEVTRVGLTASVDGAADRWSLSARINGLEDPAATLELAALEAGGSIVQGEALELVGNIALDVTELVLADDALTDAIGRNLALNAQIDLDTTRSLDLRDLVLQGNGFGATASATLRGQASSGQLDATAQIEAEDLSQFAALAGVALEGQAVAQATATAQLLTGSFDAQVTAQATNLATGIAQVDPLVTGETLLQLDAARDTDGLTLRELTLRGTALSADASGQLQSGGAELNLVAELDNLARIVPDLPGPVRLEADITRDSGPLVAMVDLSAPKGAGGEIRAQLDGDQAEAELSLGAVDLGPLLPAELLPLSVTGTAQMQGDDITAQLDLSSGAAITAQVDGGMTGGDASGRVTARVEGYADLPAEIFPVTLDGTGNLKSGAAQAVLALRAAQVADVDVTASLSPEGAIDLQVDGAAQAVENLLPAEVAPVSLSASASRAVDGLWQVLADLAASEAATLNIDGQYAEGGEGVADLALLVNPVEGLIPDGIAPVTVDGRATMSAAQELLATLALRGAEKGVQLDVTARHDGVETAKLAVTGDVTRLGDLLPDLVLPIDLDVEAKLVGTVADAKADITAGTLGEIGAVAKRDESGQAKADLTGQIRSLGVAEASAFLPLDLTGNLDQAPEGLVSADLRLAGSNASYIAAQGSLDPASGAIKASLDALIDELQRLLPRFPGQLTLQGEASNDGPIWKFEAEVAGPSQISATANGSFDTAQQTADLSTQGNLRLGGLDPFLSPNQLTGALGFDLAINGAPSVENVSGTISTQGSVFEVPALGQKVTPINATVALANGSANLDVVVGVEAGGAATVTGPVGLAAPFPARLSINLQDLILTDNLSVRSGAAGALSFNGDLLGSSLLAGQVRILPTEVNIANLGGAVSAAPVPEIRHIGESRASFVTREHAGFVTDENSGGAAPDINLDLTISALDGVKVAGMGLNANLAGVIDVDGSVAAVRPSGAIELQSGTFVILGRPLRLTDGRVSLQNSLTPFIRFAASNVNSEGSATISVEGPLDKPEVSITSVPERPPEEALALLLFGNRQSQISPVKIAQIAAQFATSGGSLFGGDVQEDDSARSRILNPTQNLYTDFAVNNDGQNEVILNLDLTDNVTARGTVDNAGDTSIGLFFQRDY